MSNTQQLLLSLSVNREADFENFFTAGQNRLTVNSLKQLVDSDYDDPIYLSGAKSSGKSHLLQAVCHYGESKGQSVLYLPLKEFADLSPDYILEAQEQMQVLCLDDVDAVLEGSQKQAWQEALFNLYNQRKARGLPVIFSASVPAHNLLTLADLQSRLCACLSFQLDKWDDTKRQQLLIFKAERLGMHLDEAVAQYIIEHYSRDNLALMQALAQLDQQSLLQGRKLTKPFAKKVLAI